MPADSFALVTGGSGGIGLELARRLAAKGHRMVITARSRETLDQAADELRKAGSPDVVVLVSDLATPGGAEAILAELVSLGINVDLLVNNAGYGSLGAFADLSEANQLEMIQLNVMSLVQLTRRLLPDMLSRGRGAIVNLSSMAAFQPGPYMTTYYATKAFVLSFSEGLREELRGSGVQVVTCCPGPTVTGFGARAGVTKPAPAGAVFPTAAQVADDTMRAFERGGLVIPGFVNKLLIQSLRIAPRRLVVAAVSRLNQGRRARN